MFDDPEFISWANENVVMLVAHQKGGHKALDVAKPAKGELKSQCPLYPGISCDDHDAIFKEAVVLAGGAGDKEKDKPAPKPKKGEPKLVLPKFEIKAYPSNYLIAPDGTFEKFEGAGSTGSCKAGAGEFQKKVDEHPIPFSKFAEVKKAVEDADAAFKAGKWKACLDACVKADQALAGQFPKFMTEAWTKRLETLNAKVAAKFADAKKGKDPAAVAKAVQALRDEFGAALTAGPLPVIADLDAFLGTAPAPAGGTEPAPAK